MFWANCAQPCVSGQPCDEKNGNSFNVLQLEIDQFTIVYADVAAIFLVLIPCCLLILWPSPDGHGPRHSFLADKNDGFISLLHPVFMD
jgi:hypothetical protein